MKKTIVLLIITSLSSIAYTQASYEVMCRNKAKELAAMTYSNCLTDERQSQIENIRSEYKEQLTHLKAVYGDKLKKISDQEESTNNKNIQIKEPSAVNEPTTDTSLKTESEDKTLTSTEASTLSDLSESDNKVIPVVAAQIEEVDAAKSTDSTDVVTVQDIPEHSSEAAVMNASPMAVTLKSADQPVIKTTKKSKKLSKVANKVAKSDLVKKKVSATKSTVAIKKAKPLPEKKIKTQSIDLNSPSEIAGTITSQ